ncbi:hypothetical protein THAOC_06962 [Thalassiosira oceanica]|uniref:Intraflagellar transport protein 52 n=1 Tax=Thalassiosira oceanica TaxID=159749 RepID=K0SYV2_THAOC|nr:hypothetical protein THAOC_06962 [Thalassiosira oceanica]|eukprot:EJK71583.1 hypothetical protein THAOC_06962 [Thalassiosira oceanica]
MSVLFDVSHRRRSSCDGARDDPSHRRLCKRLRTPSRRVHVNRDSPLDAAALDGDKQIDLLIISEPQTRFEDEEIAAIKAFVDGGGSLAVLASEAERQGQECNINQLLSPDFGIAVESKAVVRMSYLTYLHPKQALIQNGVVQPEIGAEKGVPLSGAKTGTGAPRRGRTHAPRPADEDDPSQSLHFVYPHGTTLVVTSPAYAVLSSGSTSYPVDCPVAAVWESLDARGGRVLVVGSADMFADEWLDKEENSELCNVLFRYLLRQDGLAFDPSQSVRSDFEPSELLPDVAALASRVKPCLPEDDPLPQDYGALLCDKMYGARSPLDLVPDVMDLYERLGVPYEPLSLVQPEFDTPCPPLRLATHQPKLPELPPPPLELFDLDECLTDVDVRLTAAAAAAAAASANNGCEATAVERFVREAGRSILGLSADNETGRGGELATKRILHQVASALFRHKMRGQYGDGGRSLSSEGPEIAIRQM